MKITLLIVIVFMFTVSVYGNHTIIPDSTVRYIKTIEPNRLDASNSVGSKTKLDKRFFGDFNARIEYLLEPPFGPTLGLRIYKMPNDTSFTLEVRQVSNYKEIEEQLRKEFPTLNTYVQDMYVLSQEEQRHRLNYNDSIYNRRAVECIKRYRIEAKSIPISDTLADKLYNKTLSLLRTALPVGKSPYTIFDGDMAIFRCVVADNDLWTLRYHVPSGEFKTLSDLFRVMIADVEAGKFDEAKYIEALN